MRPGVSTTKSCQRYDLTATMWKTFCLLLLMLFTFDFPRDKFARAEPIRVNAELVTRDDDQSYQDPRGQTEHRSKLARSAMHETLGELGEWQSNGQAFEPKWRDGDTIPLLPFPAFAQLSKDKVDEPNAEDYNHRDTNYRQNNRQKAYRSRNNDRISYRDYYHEQEFLPLKRNNNRVSLSQNTNGFQKINVNEEPRDLVENAEAASMKYREVFQTRPNEYEHEMNDDEYLKPRPRKRRPPQNYEFALAENETLNERKVENSSPVSQSDTRSAQTFRNAMELKSLLKMQQEEGLSLSEILQRRNLTLNDLLKGKADAITALKSKDIDETEDYTDETSKLMVNSFAKDFNINRPQWRTSTTPMKIRNSQKESERIIPSIAKYNMSSLLLKDLKSSREFPSNNAHLSENYSKDENSTTGKSIVQGLDSTKTDITPVTSTETKITTSMPLYTATNSMELLQSSESAAKLQNSGGEIKSESLDEDEIMEFSDFTDYKGGRNSMSPVWLMVQDGESSRSSGRTMKNSYEDKGSTLSIEQILSPTERSKHPQNVTSSTKNNEQFEIDSANNKTGTTFAGEDDDRLISEQPEKNYNIYSEHEYQDDVPLVFHESEHTIPVNKPMDNVKPYGDTMQVVQSKLDSPAYDRDLATQNQQTFSKSMPAEKNIDYSSNHYQGTNGTDKKSYDDVISEVEPEARAEIFELYASGSAGKRLERLLKSRNMSLEELIALRQRGSSRVHLAEVSRLKAQKPTSEYGIQNKNSLQLNATSVRPKENSMEIKEDDITDEQRAIKNNVENYEILKTNDKVARFFETVTSYSTPYSINYARPEDSITTRPHPNLDSRNENESTDLDMNTNENEEEDVRKHHQTVEILDLLTTFNSMPFAKEIQQDLANEYSNANRGKSVKNSNPNIVFIDNDIETIHSNATSTIIQSGHVEEVIKEKPNSIDLRAEYSETNSVLKEDERVNEKRNTFSRVRPTIIASGVILGVTVVIFLVIFIVCRIRQRQKYRYRNSFSRAVFQGPVLAARKLSNSSSLSTVMVNVIATSTTKRPERIASQESIGNSDTKCDIDNDSLDANDSWETIPDYMK